MGFADIHGRATVDASAPSAFGVCDQCGVWLNRRDMLWQYEYAGQNLVNQRILVCRECLDDPQPQLRPFIVPSPDPRPVLDPRPEPSIATEGQPWAQSGATYGLPLLGPDNQILLDPGTKSYGTSYYLPIYSPG